MKPGLAALLGLVMILGCGGSDDSWLPPDNPNPPIPGDVCSLIPCEGITCRNCGWPYGSCSVDSAVLVSTSMPEGQQAPFYLLMDLEVLSAVQGQEAVCPNGKVTVQSDAGEIFARDLRLDVPATGICVPFLGTGPVSVQLACPGYPTRARYRMTFANAYGNVMWP